MFCEENLLREQGVLVQHKMNKKPKKYPLKDGKFLSVQSGKLMTFYKCGNLIALKTSNQIYDPLIEPDQVAGIFKDFSG